MDRTGGGYLSGGIDHSENVRLCMRTTQTDDNLFNRYTRNKSSSFSLPKPNTPFANRSTSGYLGGGPFEPNKAPGIPTYCSMKDPALDDYFTRKFARMLSPHLPLRNMQRSSMDVERMGLRSNTMAPSIGSNFWGNKSEVLYKVAVTTADVKGAGTSVPIFVSIRGEKGNLPRTRLKKQSRPKKKKKKATSTVVKLNPGSTNVFQIRCNDLGDLESILVEHEGLEPKDSWLLQGLEIMNTDNKRIWLFTCNHWLSLYKEDGRISRELFANRSMRTKYEVIIVTGDIAKSSTEGPIFITIFGRTGVTPQLKLGKSPEDSSDDSSDESTNHESSKHKQKKNQQRKRKAKGFFNQGQSSRFVVPATCVGPITKIRIRLDENCANKNGDSWFLDRVCVTDTKHPDWRYYFSCKNWFSRSMGDGATARDIRGTKEITGIASKTSYKVSIFTSDKSGAGTHANIFLKIFGSNGESGVISIDGNKNGLPEGSVYEHLFSSKQLGSLQKIKLGHDGSGPQPRWLCDKVIINDMELSRVFEFPCGFWLSDNPGEQLFRELTARKHSDEYASYKYELEITTGNRTKASTTSRVFLRLEGPESSEMNGDDFDIDSISEKGSKQKQTKRRKTDMARQDSKSSLSQDSGTIWIKGAQFEKNRTDKIAVELTELYSPISSLHVGIAPNGKSPDWFLDDVVIFCPVTGIEQTFICGNWLSNTKEGCTTEVKLVEDISKRKQKESKEPWEISVFTSDIKDSSTSARICMVLYSTEKKTDDIFLAYEGDDNKKAIEFKEGSIESFKVSIIHVGVPYKLRIQHDNSGSNPSWHLDKVIMKRVATNEEYNFVCEKWLCEKRGDYSLVREMPAEGPGIMDVALVCMYRVQIYTGSKKYSGTDANVFINLFGDISDTGDRWLTHSVTNSNKFEKGKMDEFMIEAVDLGQIYKVKLGHDGKKPGSGWYVDKIIVTQEENTANSMTFRVQNWFDTNEGDGLIVRELTGASFLGKVTYEVLVKTGSSMGAGTDANVFLTIFGSRDDSGEVALKQSDSAVNKFEAGNIDTFKIEAEDLGEIKSIKLSQDGAGPGAAWEVDQLTILVREKGLKYLFMINEWLDKSKLEIRKDPSSIEKIEKGIPYQITVFTGDAMQAGTDANVFIQIYGRNKKTDQITLKNRTNNFERGESDVFKVNATDVERIEKIRIGHDGRGAGAGWYLEKVQIEKMVIDKGDEKLPGSGKKGKLQRTRSIQSFSSDDSRTDQVDIPRRSLFVKKGVEEEMEVYWFFCERWLATDEGDGMLSVELLPVDEDGRPLSNKREIEYRVLVKTGSVNGAGTDANVFVTIYGEDGDTGDRFLKETVDKTANKFEKNNQDEFIVKAIDLGRIERIKIRHDNAGGGAAWYLDYVLISDESQNDYLFPCYNWLAKNESDGLICREIYAASDEMVSKWRQNKLDSSEFRIQQEDKLETYHICVYTSKKRMAGTDANVDITLYGEDNDSGIVPLKKSLTYRNKFESGNCDEFDVKLGNLGELKKIKIRQDGSGGNSDWHLEKVEVSANKQGKSWVFPCNEWLSKSRGEAKLERELYPQIGLTKVSRPKMTYEITTYTSSLSGAGSSANVYIQIYGRMDCTDKKELAGKLDRDGRFKKGGVDKFYVELEDIEEPIEKIRIGHDDSGMKAGWHLDKVLVKRLMDGGRNAVTYVFMCQRWLARSEDDKAIERELLPSKILRAEEVDGETIEREEDYAGPNQLKKYTINVQTGSEQGTDSNVFLKVYGENGDSGERQLKTSETNFDKFEKNSLDRFTWEAIDLGRIYRIDIRHDNSALFKKSWYLQSVEVVDQLDQETYMFHCEKWLSKKREDGKIKRTFFVKGYDGDKTVSVSGFSRTHSGFGGSSMGSFDSAKDSGSGMGASFMFEEEDDIEISKLPSIPYTITVVTGSEPNMGSSGPIWLRLYGSGNKRTKKVRLRKMDSDEFKPASKETISIEAADVENVKEIEIGNEGADPESSWYLSSLKVEMPTKGRLYSINCGTWLSRFQGERQPCRKFRVEEKMLKKFVPKVTYSITIVTGDVDNGGTSSSLFLQLFGINGSSALYHLEKMEMRFERGGKDQIQMEMEDVGIIKRIRVQNDGNGERPHWFLESIKIDNEKTNDSFEFEYNDYLSNSLGQKKQLTINLAPIGDSKPSKYIIRTKTSDIKGAETSANVFLKIIGEYGDSGDLALREFARQKDKKLFQKGETDEFEVLDIVSLGELCRCHVWHDGKAGIFSSGEKWHLEQIEIQEIIPRQSGEARNQRGSTWKFPCNKWLSMTEDDGQLFRDLLCEGGSKKKSGRGGKEGTTFVLNVYTGDKKNAGMPHNIWLIFSGTLGYSEVYQMPNREGTMFSKGACDTISKVELPSSIGELNELTMGAYTNKAFRDSDRRRWYCNEIHVQDVVSMKTFVFEVRKWIPVHDKIDEYQGEILEDPKVTEDPGRKKVEEMKKKSLVKYDILVITGDVSRAGTNANVFLTLYGEYGDSGRLPLVQKGRDLFERKQEDRFLIECIDLGPLKSVKIEHDNSGMSADWFLDRIIVTSQMSNWTFLCQDWLSKTRGSGNLWKIIESS